MDSYSAKNNLDEQVETKNINILDDERYDWSKVVQKYQSVVHVDEMALDQYEVVLIVDNREKRNQADLNYFFEKLVSNGIKTELRSLPLGDFVWVLREKQNEAKPTKKKSQLKEYVIDFIIERKTADDLAASILDGRYEEQKFRLKNSGINNVIYLIESTPSQYCKIPESVLNKACLTT